MRLRDAAMIAACVMWCAPAFAQAGSSYTPPRGADGKPDLQGVWSNASLTNLTRPPSIPKLAVTREEAEDIVRNNPWIRLAQAEEGPSDFEDGLLDDGNSDRGYNTFWIDPGQSLATVGGEIRTSWIVDPPDGRLPVTEQGRAGQRAYFAQQRAQLYSGPESLPIWERCLIGFTGAGGPGMMNVIYNNNYQFVQTADHLMILVEMNHDARIIPIAKDRVSAKHRPAALFQWLGDSAGWWEGDTLVVETVNLHPDQRHANQILFSDKGRLTERFTRTADDQILYEFSVEDPAYYSQPWRAEMAFNARDEAVYEYACHEGNYAMEGILLGARLAEQRGETLSTGPGIFGTPIPPRGGGEPAQNR